MLRNISLFRVSLSESGNLKANFTAAEEPLTLNGINAGMIDEQEYQRCPICIPLPQGPRPPSLP